MIEIIDAIIFVIFFIYLLAASISDLKKREVPDWLSFSLLFFALSYRIILSLWLKNINIVLSTAIVFIIFFILANLFYYGKFFAGGDYKLFIALAPILAFPPLIAKQDFFFVKFLFYCMIVASIYGLVWAFVITIKNRKKFYFRKEIKEAKNIIINSFSLILLVVSFVFYIFEKSQIFLYFALFFLILPLIQLITNFADRMMIIEKKPNHLSEGDLLANDIKIGKGIIKAKWEGLNKEEINLLKKYNKKVKIKEGIPFVPVFLLAFIFSLGLPLF